MCFDEEAQKGGDSQDFKGQYFIEATMKSWDKKTAFLLGGKVWLFQIGSEAGGLAQWARVTHRERKLLGEEPIQDSESKIRFGWPVSDDMFLSPG